MKGTETSVCILEYRNYTGKCKNLVNARKLLREGWRIQLNFDPEKKLLEFSVFRFACISHYGIVSVYQKIKFILE